MRLSLQDSEGVLSIGSEKLNGQVSNDEMTADESKMQEFVDADGYLKECLLEAPHTSLMSLDRVRALRSRTELLGSVEAVEESFASATNGMHFLQQIAGALKTIVNQHVSAAQALKKARLQEAETQKKEHQRQVKEKEKEQQKEAKLQKRLANAKNEASPTGPAGAGGGADTKRRRLFPSAFTDNDPVVLTAPGWSERQVTVVENYAPRLQVTSATVAVNCCLDSESRGSCCEQGLGG